MSANAGLYAPSVGRLKPRLLQRYRRAIWNDLRRLVTGESLRG